MGDLLNWYLAPWRRMGQAEFGIWLLVISVPGLILMVVGVAEGASGWLGPIMGLMDIGNHIQQGGDLNSALQSATQVQTQMEKIAAAPIGGFNWGDFVNNLLQILMFPMCRMRLRDMGKEWPMELGWALLFNVTAIYGLLAVFGGPELPLGWVFSLLSFVGYIWLCLGRSAPRVAPYERIPGRQDP